jgi:hypothetical protein
VTQPLLERPSMGHVENRSADIRGPAPVALGTTST